MLAAAALLGTTSGLSAQMVGTPYIPEVQIPFSFLSGGRADDAPQAVELTSDGGYIVAGSSASSATGDVTGTNHGGHDWWVVKYDSLGKLQWQKLYGGSGNDVAYSIKQTSDGGYIVGGYAVQNSGDVGDLQGGTAWVIKLTSTGTISWQKGFGAGTRFIGSIVETSDGYMMAGNANGQNGRLFWAGKLSLDGNTVLWSNTYADGNNDAVFYGMAKADDGSGFILCGYTKKMVPAASYPMYWL